MMYYPVLLHDESRYCECVPPDRMHCTATGVQMDTVTRFRDTEVLPNGIGALSVYRPARTQQTGPRAVNLATAECGVTLRVGEQVQIDLGSSEWNLRVRDGRLLSEVTSGTFVALAPGNTRIYATRAADPGSTGTNTPRKLLIEIPVRVD